MIEALLVFSILMTLLSIYNWRVSTWLGDFTPVYCAIFTLFMLGVLVGTYVPR